MTEIFSRAIELLRSSGKGFTEPALFSRYVADCGLTQKSSAANYISVQSYSDLRPELKRGNAMVFRLGSRKGEKGTYFALASTKNGWQDYFLFNKEVFADSPGQEIQIDWCDERFYSFSVIPTLTETSYVNLALAAGVFEKALDLESNSIAIPATGRGNYSFKVSPHSDLGAVWEHLSGQVEIDSLFVGSHRGQKTLFIVEAKVGKYAKSLAKHKLMYPWLAIEKSILADYRIVPLYLLIDEDSERIRFSIAECVVLDHDEIPSVNNLVHKNSSSIDLIK